MGIGEYHAPMFGRRALAATCVKDASGATMRTFELVLNARGIESRIDYDAGTWRLLVSADDLLDGNRELVAYERENVPSPPAVAPQVIDNGYAGVAAYLAVIWLVMICDANAVFGWDWTNIGRLQAHAVASGELWRVVTALTLHADLGHIAANSLFGGVFGVLVGRYFGSGLGWLCIVLGGVLGNGLNVLIRHAEFSSIGASTATFAAVGLTAAFAWRSGYFRHLTWQRSFAPVFAAIAFFAYTGIGDEQTDVVAHVTGLASGFALGLGVAKMRLQLAGVRAQRFFAGMAATIVVLAWFSAI